MNTPKQISLDNGRTFMNADEAAEQLKDLGISWDEVVSFMDDDIREKVHMDLVYADLIPCTNAEFLRRYLECANDDLIIG